RWTSLGIHAFSRRILASNHVDRTYDRQPTLRYICRWPFARYRTVSCSRYVTYFLVSLPNNTRALVKRAGRGAFCASSLARRIGRLGVRTQEYAFHIFRPTVADRLCALRGGAFHSAVRMGRHHARVRTARQADVGDVAFRHVAARLLAVGTNQ